MNALKKQLLLFGIRRMPAVPVFEICDKMRPYLRTCRLRLNGEAILFTEKIKDQSGAPYENGIPYRQIIIIHQSREGTSLFMRTGQVFTFTPGSREIKITEVYTRKHTRR